MARGSGSETIVDDELGVQIINESGIQTDQLLPRLRELPEIAALTKWTLDTQGAGSPTRRNGGLLDRDRYVTPEKFMLELDVARQAAADDDVVSTVVESSEALAFSKMAVECDDADEEDVWNQIMADVDMDSRLREIWRETFICSQCYVAIWWGRKSYKVRGKTDKGVTRKRKFDNLWVPQGLSVMDPKKVVPVGNFMFNQEDLCYIADRAESDTIDAYISGNREPGSDPILERLIVGPYKPSDAERRLLGSDGYDVNRLYLLNPQMVFRHTSTRPAYKRNADVRLRSVFEILDLKHQLRHSDRTHLIGGTNFIVLIKKGTDKIPAEQEEISNLQAQVKTIARVPIIVGDHRLSVEIVTPNQDHTLDSARMNALDARISSRLYGMLMSGAMQGGRSADDSIKLARVVARGLESRRHMQRRTIESKVLMPTYRQNADFTAEPSLRFYPKRIALDFDAALATYLLDLFQAGAVSRASVLSEVDYDESDEARKRQIEKDKYDDIFMPAVLPPGSPGVAPGTGAPATDPKSAGRTRGGNRNGGGAAPGSGQGQPAKNPAKKSDGKRTRTAAVLEAQLAAKAIAKLSEEEAAAIRDAAIAELQADQEALRSRAFEEGRRSALAATDPDEEDD